MDFQGDHLHMYGMWVYLKIRCKINTNVILLCVKIKVIEHCCIHLFLTTWIWVSLKTKGKNISFSTALVYTK